MENARTIEGKVCNASRGQFHLELDITTRDGGDEHIAFPYQACEGLKAIEPRDLIGKQVRYKTNALDVCDRSRRENRVAEYSLEVGDRTFEGKKPV